MDDGTRLRSTKQTDYTDSLISVNYTINDNSSSIPLSEIYNRNGKNLIHRSFCQWLDHFMYWQAMWTIRTPNNKYRNRIINIIGITISVLYLPMWIVYTFHDYSAGALKFIFSTTHERHKHHFNQKQLVLTIVNILIITFGTFSRIFAMYYMIFKFNFPWHNFKLKYHNSDLTDSLETYLNSAIKKVNRRLIVYITVSITLFALWMKYFIQTVYIEGKKKELLFGHWFENNYIHYHSAIIDGIVTFFGIQFPMVLFPIIWSIISLKYQFNLYYLQCLINWNTNINNTPNFVMIWKKYKTLQHEFKQSHTLWSYYIILYVIFYSSYLWIYLTIMIDPKIRNEFKDLTGLFDKHPKHLYPFIIFSLLAFLMPLIEYTISSSYMNHEYNKFLDLLWKYDNFNDSCTEDDIITISSHSQSHINRVSRSQVSQSKHLFNKYGSNSKKKKKFMDEKLDIEELSVILFNVKDFHFLLHWVPKFPLQVTIFSLEINPITLLKCLAAFATTKVVTWMIQMINR